MQKLEKQFHIHCAPGDVGRYCILPGDPGRVPAIAALFDDAKQVAYNREFNVWTGYLMGEKVTACSTGIGGPSASIAMDEHTSLEYAPIEYPAVPDLGVTNCLAQATRNLGLPLHTGVVQCKDSFYGQHSPEKSPVYYELQAKWESWKRLGVKASEMESAALFVVAAALGCRCGSCFHVIWNQEREAAGLDQKMSEDTSSAVRVAVEALKLLIQADRSVGK